MSTGCSAGSDGDVPRPSASSAMTSAPASRVAASFAAGRGSRTNREAAAIVSASASASSSLRGSGRPSAQHNQQRSEAASCSLRPASPKPQRSLDTAELQRRTLVLSLFQQEHSALF